MVTLLIPRRKQAEEDSCRPSYLPEIWQRRIGTFAHRERVIRKTYNLLLDAAFVRLFFKEIEVGSVLIKHKFNQNEAETAWGTFRDCIASRATRFWAQET